MSSTTPIYDERGPVPLDRLQALQAEAIRYDETEQMILCRDAMDDDDDDEAHEGCWHALDAAQARDDSPVIEPQKSKRKPGRPPTLGGESRHIGVRMPIHLYDALSARAKATPKASKSDLVRDAVREFIEGTNKTGGVKEQTSR